MMTKTGKARFSLAAIIGVLAVGWLLFHLLERL
jgi:hypothetical protein